MLHSVCQSVCLSHAFSRLSLAMLSHTFMKVTSNLRYEDLHIEFDFRYGGWMYFFLSYCPFFKILPVTFVFVVPGKQSAT